MCPLKHIVPLCKHAAPAESSFPEESNLTTSHIIKSLFFMHWWICLLGRHILSVLVPAISRTSYAILLVRHVFLGLGLFWVCVWFFSSFSLCLILFHIFDLELSQFLRTNLNNSVSKMLAVVSQIGISCIFYKDTLHSFICIIKESFGRYRIGPPKNLLETTSNIVTESLILNVLLCTMKRIMHRQCSWMHIEQG